MHCDVAHSATRHAEIFVGNREPHFPVLICGFGMCITPFSYAFPDSRPRPVVFSVVENMLPRTVLAIFCVALLMLSLVSLNRYVLVSFYRRNRGRWFVHPPQLQREELPTVVVQLPIYNERYVVGRLIKSAIDLDYPRELL